MDATQGWIVVLGLAAGTFLIRYSFIGLMAERSMPLWLERALQLMVPAIFAAIVCSGVAIVGGQLAGPEQWPRYGAAAVATLVAVRTRGSLMPTVLAGMAALHALGWLARQLG